MGLLTHDKKFISQKFRGFHEVTGSCGRYNRDPQDTIESWIEREACFSAGNRQSIIFDGKIMCRVSTEMVQMSPPCPNNNSPFTYQRELYLRTSPNDNLPRGLQEVLTSQHYEEVKI